MSDEPAVRVTLPEIYKDVQDVKTQVASMDHKLDKFIQLNDRLNSHKEDISDHETRLSALERAMAAAKVIIAIITAAATAAVVKVFVG